MIKRIHTKRLLLTVMSCAFGLSTQGQMLKLESGPARVNLVELYTSEGCANCPPAEEWMVGLKEAPGLWSRFVPISFHVDYWDKMGWRDPFSSDFFTSRQFMYIKSWGEGRMFTPCFVIDGKSWQGWSSEFVPPESPPETGGVLRVVSATNGTLALTIQYQPPGTGTEYIAYGALMGNNLRVSVTNGENAGKQLNHDFVVLALEQQKMKAAENGFETKFSLEEGKVHLIKKYSLAVWVSRVGEITPVQATGAFLP